jgi:hypothetical protein
MRRCTYCGSEEHPVELCPYTWGGSAKRAWGLRCGYCGSNLHDTKYCPYTWGGYANRRKNENGLYLD